MGKVKKHTELLKKEVKEIIQKSEDTSEKIKKVRIIGEFLEFINRGNVVDLAVGVVVGGAFTAIVNSLVKDLITPLLGLLLGKLDLTNLKFNEFSKEKTPDCRLRSGVYRHARHGISFIEGLFRPCNELACRGDECARPGLAPMGSNGAQKSRPARA